MKPFVIFLFLLLGVTLCRAQEENCQALMKVASDYKTGQTTTVDKAAIDKLLAGVDLKQSELPKHPSLGLLIEDYFALKFIAEGASTSEAWGGMSFNTSVPTVGNRYDYDRYEGVLRLGSNELITTYLSLLPRVFRYNGYTEGLERLRPLIEQKMPDGKLKQEINRLYVTYADTKRGAQAADFKLKDLKGDEYTLASFRGKLLVVDLWATWCGGCIKKLPAFVAISQKYAGRDDIEFITISIDDPKAYNTWKYSLPRHKLLGLKNLIATGQGDTFRKDYRITGIPRYMIIDGEGKVVNLYAPSPGKEMEEMIEVALKGNTHE